MENNEELIKDDGLVLRASTNDYENVYIHIEGDALTLESKASVAIRSLVGIPYKELLDTKFSVSVRYKEYFQPLIIGGFATFNYTRRASF